MRCDFCIRLFVKDDWLAFSDTKQCLHKFHWKTSIFTRSELCQEHICVESMGRFNLPMVYKGFHHFPYCYLGNVLRSDLRRGKYALKTHS